MKKRSLLAILMVAIALFISLNLFSDQGSTTSNNQNQQVFGNDKLTGNSAGDVNGIYIPD